MVKNILPIILICLLLGGCIANQKSLDETNLRVLKNADNIDKLTSYVDSKFKDEIIGAIKKEVKASAENAFSETIKDTGAITENQVKTGVKVAGSITEALGIPYGGIAVDVISAIALLFAGKKGAEYRNQQIAKRKKEQDDWEKYLASLSPEDAKKAIEMNT